MKYSARVYVTIQEFFNENEGIILTWEDIDKMNKYDVLDAFLKWEGIIGYTGYIYQILESK